MRQRFHFRGGVHPPEYKHQTDQKPVEIMPVPERVVVPLQQHIGAAADPVVQKGDEVKTGQVIGKAGQFVSVPVHASISGTVTAVEPHPHPLGVHVLSVVIEGDGKDNGYKKYKPSEEFKKLTADEVKECIMKAGIAGMGGAAFPSHVKLSPPDSKPIDTVILNGVECEPFLTSDHRLMLEEPDSILEGLKLIMKILNVKKAIIGIEKNKPDAINLMENKTKSRKNISVLPLKVKYPQGAEKQLIQAATGRKVPSGGLPMDVGCLVHNVGTALAIFEAVAMKKPLIERVVTVTGSGIREPKNLRIRIGTLYKDVIDFCGGLTDQAVKIINGGPMMGIAQISDETPVIKGSSGLLILDQKSVRIRPENPCIGCARCVDTCPATLLPTQMAAYIKHGMIDNAYALGLPDCIECGSCGYICPANIPLVQYFKMGKILWSQAQQKNEQAA